MFLLGIGRKQSIEVTYYRSLTTVVITLQLQCVEIILDAPGISKVRPNLVSHTGAFVFRIREKNSHRCRKPNPPPGAQQHNTQPQGKQEGGRDRAGDREREGGCLSMRKHSRRRGPSYFPRCSRFPTSQRPTARHTI